MQRTLILAALLVVSLTGWSQSWRQAAEANDTNTVSFSPTAAGSVDVVLSYLSPAAGASVTDNKGQTYTLDACTSPLNGVLYGDAHTCIWYVCGGAAGVTSVTINGPQGGYVLAAEFFEGTGVITTSNCAGAVNTITGPNAPTLITLTPDQPSELALVGFACAGTAFSVNGNVAYTNEFNDAGDPAATTVIKSTSVVTAETDNGSADCIPTDDENPSGWNSTFAAFRTAQPTSSCPSSAPVPSLAGCAYNENLGSEAVGSTSSAQTLNVAIASGTTVGSIGVLATGVASKDFGNATGSTCTASTYNTATNCVVNVSFTPLASGLRRGAIVFYSGTNNSGTVLATVPVYGIGTGPQIAFGPGGAQSDVGSGFSSPEGVAVDGAGDLFVADPGIPAIYRIAPTGTKTTVGSGFVKPEGIAVDGAGNVYVADSIAAVVDVVTPGGVQTTVGSGLSSPTGVAVDGAGNVYIADSGKVAVYEVTPGGTQTKIGSGFSQPTGVAVDGAGDVYVADPGGPAVYEITKGGTQTTVGSGFSQPEGAAVDAAGNVYVVDAGVSTVYKVTPGGVQSTVSSGLDGPMGLALDGPGNLYVANTGKSLAVKIDRADAPSLSFATTNVGSTSADSPKSIEVENVGNMALTLTGLSYPTDFPEATGDESACTGTTSLNPALQCDLPIDFIPRSVASLHEDVVLTDNALNVTSVQQSVALNGTGAAGTTNLTSPAPGSTLGTSNVTFTWISGTGATKFQLWLGLGGPGSSSLYTSGWLTATSTTVASLPAKGATIYARLYTMVNGKAEYNDYTYTETSAGAPAAMSTPTPGSTLGISNVIFTWTSGTGATEYQLWLGLGGLGSSDLYASGWLTMMSATATSLPAKGATVYARLYSMVNGKLEYNDYTYTESSAGVPATLSTPTPGSTLGASNVMFTWTSGTGATEYQLWLGLSGLGSSDLYASGWLTKTSTTVASLPAKGATIYARLYTMVNGKAESNDYTYIEQ